MGRFRTVYISVTLSLLLHHLKGACDLDEWGLPTPDNDNSRVFHVPSVIPLTYTDKSYYFDGLYLSEAILYTIQWLNKRLLKEQGFCLTTSIIDNSMMANVSVSEPLKLTEPSTMSLNGTCRLTKTNGALVGFLGAAISDNSIALANLCNVLKIPQISYASTTLDFDDKEAYPFFMRTVPSDQLQAAAIVRIITETNGNWGYVGIIASEGNYGGAGLSAFLTEASNKTDIAFQLRIDNSDDRNRDVARNVIRAINETEIRVIVLFSNGELAVRFFSVLHDEYDMVEATLKDRIREIIYIGSDSVASHSDLLKNGKYLGNVFRRFIGIGVYMNEIKGFADHLSSLSLTNYNNIYKHLQPNYMQEFLKNSTRVETIINKIDPHSSSSSDAAYAFGVGLSHYIRDKNITNASDVDREGLNQYIKELKVIGLTDNLITFSNESTNVGQYMILQYNMDNNTLDEVGTFVSPNTLKYNNPYKDVSSICSKACNPGQWKNPTSPGCHECIPCDIHKYSEAPNQLSCSDCDAIKTNNSNHTACLPIPPTTIPYTGTFAITLYLLITGGLLAITVTMVVFYINFHTPVVQGHGVFIYVTQLSTCVLLLASTILFLGEPTKLICDLQIAIPVLGISTIFLCIICLTKTIILKVRAIKTAKFYFIQISVLIIGLIIQGVLVLIVLLVNPRKYEPVLKSRDPQKVVHGNCVASNNKTMIDGLIYFGLLIISLSSLVLSFLGRNINENYSEGKFLAFQSIALHIVIAAFVPTMLVLSGPTRSGAWAVTLVITCYIVIIVLFIPKLYIIIYRPYKNRFTEELVTIKSAKENGNGNS